MERKRGTGLRIKFQLFPPFTDILPGLREFTTVLNQNRLKVQTVELAQAQCSQPLGAWQSRQLMRAVFYQQPPIEERLDKLGLELAKLQDDTPTVEEFDDMENRVGKLEKQASTV